MRRPALPPAVRASHRVSGHRGKAVRTVGCRPHTSRAGDGRPNRSRTLDSHAPGLCAATRSVVAGDIGRGPEGPRNDMTSYAADIRPMFSDLDVQGMSRAFDLRSYDACKAHA